MRRRAKIAILALSIVLLLASQLVFPVWVFLPHDRIVLRVPFEWNDPPTRIAPMGETIEHPKPDSPRGHPGIDWQWEHPAAILSASDGWVLSVRDHEGGEGKDVVVRKGVYEVRYAGLVEVPPHVRFGAGVAKGDFLGRPADAGLDRPHYSIHWELASIHVILDRYCPMSYFDEESRRVVEEAWARVPAGDVMKRDFPEICSGDYAGRSE